MKSTNPDKGKPTRKRHGDSTQGNHNKPLRGFTPGNKLGGRKPRVIEMKAREFILKCIGGEAGVKILIMKAFEKARRGSYKHQEMLFNYILGKPTETIKIDAAYAKGDLSSPAVVKIIADTIRLEKLSKDMEAVQQQGISEERIKEMEDVVNKQIDKDSKALKS